LLLFAPKPIPLRLVRRLHSILLHEGGLPHWYCPGSHRLVMLSILSTVRLCTEEEELSGVIIRVNHTRKEVPTGAEVLMLHIVMPTD
jgi:hypothetical protein